MIYSLYETRRVVANVVYDGAELGARLHGAAAEFGWPAPFSRFAQATLGTLSMSRVTHERPEFGVDSAERDGRSVPVREEEVLRTPFATLQHFVAEDGAELPKVLIVPGLAGHFATLVRATVKTMLADHDVYVADWHNARDVPVDEGPFGLDEYISHLIEFTEAIGPDTALVAVCQPCVPVLAAAAIMTEDENPAAPRALILIAGPVDARINPGPVNETANKYSLSTIERLAITKVSWPHKGAGRRVYPGFVQMSGFLGMAPGRHAKAFGSHFMDVLRYDDEDAARLRDFYEEYFAVLDIAAEFYLDTSRVIFREHDFARGEMRWRDRLVDPTVITQPLFTIEGENDEFCPPGQTEAAHTICTSVPDPLRRHHLQTGVGHYGAFSGSRFEAEIYPQIREFLDPAAVPA